MRNRFNEYLLEFGYKENDSLDEMILFCDISMLKLRDGLSRIGHILKEDFQNGIYMVSIRAGVFNVHEAVVICQLKGTELSMLAFAREGLIKQNTCKKAMDKIGELIKC